MYFRLISGNSIYLLAMVAIASWSPICVWAGRGVVSEMTPYSDSVDPLPRIDSDALLGELENAKDLFIKAVTDEPTNAKTEAKKLFLELRRIQSSWIIKRKEQYTTQRLQRSRNYNLEAEREYRGRNLLNEDRWSSKPASGSASHSAPGVGWIFVSSVVNKPYIQNENPGGSAEPDKDDPTKVNAYTHSTNEANKTIEFTFTTNWQRSDSWCQNAAESDVNSVIKTW